MFVQKKRENQKRHATEEIVCLRNKTKTSNTKQENFVMNEITDLSKIKIEKKNQKLMMMMMMMTMEKKKDIEK